MLLIISFVVALVLVIGTGYFIRWLGDIPFYWVFASANCAVVITPKDAKDGDITKDGGGVVNILHDIPGHWIDKSSPDAMQWEVKRLDEATEDEDLDGKVFVDPDHTGFLFNRLGVQKMGLWRYAYSVPDKRLRYTRKADEETLHTMSRDKILRNIPYSGEMTIRVEEADTADGLFVIIELDIIFERQFFVRSIFRIADSNAFLSSQAEELVNKFTTTRPAEHFLGGDKAKEFREELATAMEEDHPESLAFRTEALRELGLKITQVNVRSVSMKPEQRELLTRRIDAEKEAERKLIEAKNTANQKIAVAEGEKVALMKVAEGERQATILRAEGEAERIKLVKDAIGGDPAMVTLEMAEKARQAYVENKTVTTVAIGGNGITPVLPLGTMGPK